MQYLLGPQGSALFLLIAEIFVLIGLFYGFYLIRYRRNLKGHKQNQTILVFVNMLLILLVMVIGFYRYVILGAAASPALSRLMIAHATLGTVTELMGIYILLRMSNRLPGWLEIPNYKVIMRVTLALWTIVALDGFVIYYSQYAADGNRGGVGQPQIPTVIESGVPGLVVWSDENGFNDRVTLLVTNLPLPAPGTVYQGWLVSRSSAVFESLGVMEVDNDRTSLLDYRSPFGSNLLAPYDQVVITAEKAPASKSGPSPTIVISGEIPQQAGSHLLRLLVMAPDSPGGIGLIDALGFHGAAMFGHAREIESAWRRGNLASMKRHAEHAVNLVEGTSGKNFGDLNRDGVVQDPGDGPGLLTYAKWVSEQTRLAADSPDATSAMKAHAPHIITMVDNVNKWASRVRDDALAVINATNSQTIEAQVTEAVALSARTVAGFDDNGDGEVSPAPDEGGMRQVLTHSRMMARLALRPGPGTLVQNLHPPTPPAPPPPAPAPGPQTVIVQMEDFEYKDKTVVINRGTTVIWANNDTAAHNVIQDDRKFASGTMPKGDTFSYTFNEAGRFPYYCEFHGDKGGIDMAGLVIVQ